MSNLATGTVLANLTEGPEFGWLAWAGKANKKILVQSLTSPGDVNTYVNPDDATDRVLNMGDWVGTANAVNNKEMRDALNALKNVDITVPVWDLKRGNAATRAYRVGTYAVVRLLDYDLTKGRISLRFLRFVSCETPNQPPVVYAGDDTVVVYPNSLTLRGRVTDDGLPRGAALTLKWKMMSGPGQVTFGNATSSVTTASFSARGQYVLCLKASDSEFSTLDELNVIVDDSNRAPVANTAALTTLEDTAVAVTLTGSDADGDALSCVIVSAPRFGVLSGIAPSLVYTPGPNFFGTDSFQFVMNDGSLQSAVTDVVISVTPMNDAPVAQGQNVSVQEDNATTITLSGIDVEGSRLTFSVLELPAHGVLTGADAQWVYSPARNYFGTDQFTFKANDGELDSATATVRITVQPVNDPPVALPQSVRLNEDVGVDLVLGCYDVESDPLTCEVVSGPSHGVLSGTPPNLRYTPALDFNGTDSFSFLVRDGSSASATASVTLTVVPVNDPPVAAGQAVALDEDGQLPVALSASDVDGDTVILSIVSGPLHGSLSGTPPNLTYVPAQNFNGSDRFTFKANDGVLDSTLATVAITVRPVNDPPVAVGQSVTLNEDGSADLVLAGEDVDADALTFELVAGPSHGVFSGTLPNVRYTPAPNFHGADAFSFLVRDGSVASAPATVSVTVLPVNDPPVALGQSLAVDEDRPLGIQLNATDVDGDALTLAIVNGPSHGSLAGTPPNVTYVPAANFNGSDQFKFQASDGVGGAATAIVSITVRPVNDPPVAVGQSVTFNEDGNVDVMLAGQDIDGDVLTFELVAGPSHGVLSGTLPNVRYTPVANFHGTDAFSFLVRDGSVASAPASVSVTVVSVNDAPVAVGQSLAVDEDVQLAVELSATDVDGDAVTLDIVNGPAHGSLLGTPPNVTYVPAQDFNGNDQFTFQASDGAGGSATATVDISVRPVNDPPVAVAQVVTLDEDGNVNVVLAGHDVDGDTLTFEIVGSPGHGALSGTAPNVRYTAEANFNGDDAFSFVVRDGLTVSAPATVNITVAPVNDPPVAAGQSLTLDEDGQVAVVLSGSDVDGDALTFTVTRAPQHGSLLGTAPNLTYVPAANFNGDDSFEFAVEDGTVGSASASVSLTVVAVNDAPVGNNQSVSLLEDGTLGILLSGSDVESSPLTFAVLNAPQHGVLSGTPPNLVYAPVLNFNGSDSFTFSANDGELDSALATVQITVIPVNDPPVAYPQTLNVVEGQNFPIRLTADDVDGDVLTYTVVTQPRLGPLSGTPPNVSYQAPVGVYETDNLEFVVSDGTVTTSPAPVQLTLLRRVEAGPNRFAHSTSDVVSLLGLVRDNGLPAVIAWQKKFGPGNVVFSDVSNPLSTATFTSHGIYLLELTATDSMRVARDTVEVRVGVICNNPAPAGLVGWWQASGDPIDYISGKPATLQQGTTFDVGKVGAGFRFDGVDDRVLVPASTALDIGQGSGFTIEFWMNSADVARTARLLAWHSAAGTRVASTNWGVNIYQSSGNLYAQVFDLTGNPHEMIAFTTLVNNTWTHVGVSYDRASGQGRIYINGVLRVSTQLGSYTPRANWDLYFGHVPVETIWYRGLLDEVSVYNRALDPEAIYNVYAAGDVGKCRENGNQAPLVSAGPDVILRDVGGTAPLAGRASDTTLPGGPLRVLWTKVSGPGTVTFADAASASTTAVFDAPGIYVLRLTADDAEFSVNDLMEVRVGQLCTVGNVPGLVAWWPGNGDANESVAGREGLLVGGTTFGLGKVAGAFNFDGVNDIVQVPAHPSLDLGAGNGLTVEFWMNSADVSRPARLIAWHSSLAVGGTNNGLNIYQSGGNLFAQLTDLNGNPHEIILFAALANNVWTHVAVIYDRTIGHAKIYLNGVPRLTVNVGSFTPRTSYNVYFGNLPFDIGYYKGLLDEVSFYNRALDAQEVYEAFAAQSVGKCPLSNQAPLVSAGPDVELASVTDTATLNGQVSDDGVPAGASVQVAWSKVDGPGTVTFADNASPVTTASFSAAGLYVLRLTGNDGGAVRSDTMEVRVANVCVSTPADLAAWWPGNGSADEVVGMRNGRLAAGATFASGKVSAAFSFDGTNDAVHVPADASLDLGAGQGFTIEFWMNSADVARVGRLVGWHYGLPGSATNFGVNVYQYSGNLYAQVTDMAGNPHEIVAFGVTANNTWMHVAVSYDRASGQGRIYVNGVQRATGTLGSYRAQTTYNLFFGNVPSDTTYYRGLLDEVSFYRRALALNEVQAIYNGGAGGKCHAVSGAPEANTSVRTFAAHEDTGVSVTQNEAGLRTRMVDPSGATDYHYEGGRLLSVSKVWNAVAGQPEFTSTLTYDYDEAGRLVGVHSSSINGVRVQYGYDSQNRLTEVFDPHSGRSVYHLENGQMLCTYPNGQTVVAFAAAPPSDNVGTVEVSEPGKTTTLVYDADGNLVLQTVVTDASTVVRHYVVDPLNFTGAPQVVEELTSGVVTRVDSYGYQLISHDELVNGEWTLQFVSP